MRCSDPPSPTQRRLRRLSSLVVLPVLLSFPADAGAVARAGIALAPAPVTASASASEAAAVARYWTPARMRSARPLDRIFNPSAAAPDARGSKLASASFATVPDTTQPPFTAVGRVFLKVGGFAGFCSGTAINSASRRLVLTAGHCLYSILPGHRIPTSARYFDFVPDYSGGQAPFGEFIGRKGFLPRPWLRSINENYDMAAVLTEPNASGVNVADAVGGGIPIATDRARDQEYQVLGYPGGPERKSMQECDAGFSGDDRLTYPLGGPPSLGVGCYMGEGASGGPWLINAGTEVGGITTYGHIKNFTHTFGPYFSSRNVGALVKGL
jgi:V8-like Glu-specific endopeptidase